MNIFKLTLENGNTLEINYSEYTESPRVEFDNLGKMCFYAHRRYTLPNEINLFDEERTDKDELLRGIKRELGKDCVVLPIYWYEHSGISLSIEPFPCQWDSCLGGYIAISREQIRKEYSVSRVSKDILSKVESVLKAEVEMYSKYLNGSVYEFSIIDSEGEIVDSCCGFYEISDMLDYLNLSKKETEMFMEESF